MQRWRFFFINSPFYAPDLNDSCNKILFKLLKSSVEMDTNKDRTKRIMEQQTHSFEDLSQSVWY